MPADIRPILDPIKVDSNVKADAWDSFHASTSPEDFKARFDKLKLPDSTKADLWDAKFGASAAPAAPVTAPAPQAPQGLDAIDQATLGANVQTFQLMNGPQLATGQRLPTADEAVAGAEAQAKVAVDRLLRNPGSNIPGMEKLGQLPGVPSPQNPIQPLTTPLGGPNGRNADGFTAGDFGGKNGTVNVPQGEFQDAMTAYGEKVLGQTPEGTGLPMAVGRGTAKFLLNLMSPESAATVLAFEMGGAAAPAIANAAPIARALRELPKVAKALDVIGNTAAPAAGVYLGGKGTIEGGKQAYDEAMQGHVSASVEAATETALNALLMGMSASDATKKARETLASFPTQQNAPSTFSSGQDQATTLRAQGKRLAADQWAAEARKVATNKWQQVFGDEIPVSLNGADHTIKFQGSGERGRPSFAVVNDATGQTVFSGYGRAVQDFLRGRGAKSKTAEATAGEVPAEVAASDDTGSAEAPAAPTVETSSPGLDAAKQWVADQRAEGVEPRVADVQRQFKMRAGDAFRALGRGGSRGSDRSTEAETQNAAAEPDAQNEEESPATEEAPETGAAPAAPVPAPALEFKKRGTSSGVEWGSKPDENDPVFHNPNFPEWGMWAFPHEYLTDPPEHQGAYWELDHVNDQLTQEFKDESTKDLREKLRDFEERGIHRGMLGHIRAEINRREGLKSNNSGVYVDSPVSTDATDSAKRNQGEADVVQPERLAVTTKDRSVHASIDVLHTPTGWIAAKRYSGATGGGSEPLTPHDVYPTREEAIRDKAERLVSEYEKALGGQHSKSSERHLRRVRDWAQGLIDNTPAAPEPASAAPAAPVPAPAPADAPKNVLQKARDRKRAAKSGTSAAPAAPTPVPAETPIPRVQPQKKSAQDTGASTQDTELEEPPPSESFADLEHVGEKAVDPIRWRGADGKTHTGAVEQIRTTPAGKRLVFARDEQGKAHVFGPERILRTNPRAEKPAVNPTKETALDALDRLNRKRKQAREQEPGAKPDNLFPIAETPDERERRIGNGYTQIQRIHAGDFMQRFERDTGQKLEWKPERTQKLAAYKTVNGHPFVTVDEVGRVGVDDGRHRITLAAIRNQDIEVATQTGVRIPEGPGSVRDARDEPGEDVEPTQEELDRERREIDAERAAMAEKEAAPAPQAAEPVKPVALAKPLTFFTGSAHDLRIIAAAKSRQDMGIVVTPMHPDYLKKAEHFPYVMIDNGVFSTKGFNADKFRKLLDKAAADPALKKKVYFVVAPDVLVREGDDVRGDAAATLAQFPEWSKEIRGKGFPVAFVAQNGLENMTNQIPWSDMDVLFIGGSKDWKFGEDELLPPGSPEAKGWIRIFSEAKKRGIPIHVGRVYREKHFEHVFSNLGVQSIDSTHIAYDPTKNLAGILKRLDRRNENPTAPLYDEAATIAAEDAIEALREGLKSNDPEKLRTAVETAKAVHGDERPMRDQHRKILGETIVKAERATKSQPTPQETPANSAPEAATQTDAATNSEKPVVPKSPKKPRKLKTESTADAGTDRAASTEPQGKGNRGPLAEKPSEDGSRSGEVGETPSGTVRGAGADTGSSVRSGSEAEHAAKPGRGDRAEGVPTPSERGGQSGSPVRSGPVNSASSPVRDFRITDADAIGTGTQRQKANDNIAAIRLVKQLETEGRQATREEQATLAKYVGWGGISQAFDAGRYEWRQVHNDLRDILTDDEFKSARASTPNAHYTSPMVIRAMWDAAERLGLQPGARIIEPAIGVGNFFGLQPENLLPGVKRTGVELDSITGRIATLLYPDANIQVKGFEKFVSPNNFFDLAISNVPFGNYGVYDSAYKKAPRAITGSIHDFFFAKALDKVRPGGVVAFITSSYTMDKKDSTVRQYLSDRANLIGAIRLPNTAFKGNAGTEVTTDIIFLQKRPPQTEASGETWLKAGESKTKSAEDITLNEYYLRHPEMMLGEMSVQHGMYANNEQTLNGTLTPELLAAAVQKLPEGIIKPWEGEQSAAFQTPLSEVPAAGATKNNGFAVDKKGTVVVRRGDSFEPANLSQKAAEKVKALLPVRDAVREVYRTQLSDTATEAQVTKARTDLNRIYDAFVKKHGFISEKENYKAFDGDPDQPVLLSLEDYDTEKKTAKKTDVFSKRTIDRHKQIDKAETASEALTIALNELGRIDFGRMQQLTGKTPAELQAELGPLAYKNPDGAWETADEYLSGNVRAKLNVAEEAAKADPVYQRNVDALKSVQPEDLQSHEIEAGLGATWVPKEDIAHFIAQTLEISPSGISVGYAAPIGQWVLHIKYGADTVSNSQTFGTRDFFGHELISNEMNGKIPVAYDHFADGSSAKNVERSIAAQDKQEQLAEKFRQWIWADEARATRLARKYNDEFNNLRLREYDGSHLTFPGMARLSLRGGDLDPHQKNAVWRILQSGGNTLLAHVVGAGKTFEMVTAAMEMRRLGLAKKPMFAVPNHLVEQTGAEFLRLYPAANLFVAGKEYFEGGERERAMARIASGNYDAVIVAHSSFGRIPIKDETYDSFMQEQLQELEDAIEEMSVAEGKKGKTVKELEKAKKRLQAKIEKRAKRDEKDTAIDFESLGVDALFVDEAHMFKNLFFMTKRTRVAGLPTSESDRAFDMFMKTQYVSKLNGGRGVVFATGTPISNTLAEMYTMQRYLQLPYLKQQGMGAFDAWANNFAKSVNGMELAPDGSGYRMNTRFAKFVNLPELISGFRLTADIQTAEMLNLPRPKLQGGKPVGVPAPASPGLKAFVQTLVKRAEDVRGGKVDPRDDNMLLITTHGRWAALDMRMVDPNAPNDPNSKVNQTIDRVYKIWNETKEHTFNDGTTGPAAQLVFLDFSMPLKHRAKNSSGALTNFSAYDEIKAQLLKKGVPASEVAFIHDYDGDAKKAQLFTAVRAGKIRILLGSTEKMGAGTNVQKRLIALHHVDAPWRPSDIEQREGRILRQGNTNPEVQVYRYVTEGSFDAYMWQTLENKAKFIAQVMRGGSSVRSLEDLEGGALTYAEIKAIASGNPAVMEKVKVDTELRKLESLKTTHDGEKRRSRMEMASLPGEIAKTEGEIERYKIDIALRDSSEKVYTVGKRTFTGDDARKQAGDAVHTILENTRDDVAPFRIGSYQGFELWTKKASSGFGQSAGNLPDISIRGKGYEYQASSNDENPLATLQSIEGTVRNLDHYPQQAGERLAKQRKMLADYSAKVNDPFSQEGRLVELRAKQKELAAALDLGKSDKQAGTAADDTSPRPVSELLSDEAGSFNPGALVDAAKDAYNSEGMKGARNFFKPLSLRIAEQGKAGKKLSQLLIKARDEGETAAGPRVARIVYDSGVAKLSRDERFDLMDALDGKGAPMNAAVQRAFDAIRSVTDELAAEATALGVKVKRTVRLGPSDPIPQGAILNVLQQKRRAAGQAITLSVWVPYRKRNNYYPHHIPSVEKLKRGKIREDVLTNIVRRGWRADKAAAEKFLEDYIRFVETAKGGNALMTWLVQTQQAPNYTEAMKLLEALRKDMIRRNRNLEYSRSADLPFYDPDPARVMPAFATAESKRLKQIEHFGQDHQRILALRTAIKRQGGNSDWVKQAVDEILGQNQQPDGQLEAFSRWLRMVQGFKLGLAGIPNVTQGSLNSLLKGDLESVVEGWTGLLSAQGRRFGTESGAALDSILNEAMRNAGEDGRALGTFLAATGFTATERWNRILAANAGAAWAKKQARKLRLDPRHKSARRALTELGVDPDAVIANGGQLTPHDVLTAAKKFSDITQFRGGPEDLPEFASGPVGKVVFQFKQYVYGQTRLILDTTIQEWQSGDRGRAVRNLLILAAVFPMTGVIVNALRGLLKRRNGKDETVVRKYLEGAMSVGAAGALGDLVEGGIYRKAAGTIVGPTISTVAEGIEAGVSHDPGRNLAKWLMRQGPFGSVLAGWMFPPQTGGGRSPRRLGNRRRHR